MLDDIPQDTKQRFFRYHRENPDVWQAFKKYAIKAFEAGRTKYGAKSIMERVRWDLEIERKGEFKINNNFTAYYARVFIEKFPKMAGLFETREIKGLKEVI